MTESILKLASRILLGMAVYILNDFTSDINSKFENLNKSITSMSVNIVELNTTMSSVIAKDETRLLQINANTKTFERMEKEHGYRLDRIENLYFELSRNKNKLEQKQ